MCTCGVWVMHEVLHVVILQETSALVEQEAGSYSCLSTD